MIALTGDPKIRERFIVALARHGNVATISNDEAGQQMFADEAVKDLLCIKSPSGHILRRNTSSGAHEITRELDRLAEQGDIDFAVLIGDALASRVISFREVYKARLELSGDFDKHLESLTHIPEWITLGTLVEAVRSHPDIHKAGAILTFTGVVRGDALALEFDIYDGEAQRRIGSIVQDLTQTEGIVDVRIHHKSGRIERGEDIVYIVVAAAHRQEGFKVLRDAIERLKKEVPIWKKELTEHGEKWLDV